MMHAQSVGVSPAAPGNPTITGTTGSGPNRANVIAWEDQSKNETAFVVQRRVAGSTNGWTTVATVPSEQLGTAAYTPGTGATKGTRTYNDRVGNDRTVYEYSVYAINVVGDVWNYSDPALNNIPPGGGFPTLTLDSRGEVSSSVSAPTNLTASAVAKSRKASTVTLNWTDTANNESGFLIQRSDNTLFTQGVVNATIGANLQTFSQTVTPGKTYYYRVLAFNDTHQSGWSNTAPVTTP